MLNIKFNDTNKNATVERILSENSDFNTVETFKSIRTNIRFSLPKSEGGKVICVTSSAPGEGKTTTVINLAITHAQMGAKVLLVDCDLRKSTVHKYLQIKRHEGVTDILCGFTDFDSAVRKNVRPNLDILTAGEVPPNPAELLETDTYTELIEQLKTKYDYIFIDTPPTTIVTDAILVTRHCTGTVVVVKENITTFDLLDETMSTLKKASAKVIGVIMLGVNQKGKKYGYYKNRKNYEYKSIPSASKNK